MAADAGVVPVGHVDRPVGGGGHVDRPEPVIVAGEQDLVLGPEVRAVPLDREEVDLTSAGVGLEKAAFVGSGEERAFVDHDPARRAVAGADELGDVAGDFLAPVPGTAWRVVAVGAAVHDPDDPGASVAVVVVVGGEGVAEGVEAGLVVVALAVGDDLELGPVAVDAEGVGQVRRADVAARGVDHVEVPAPVRPVLRLERAAAVAVGEVELAVQAQGHPVDAVVGVDPAEAGQEDRLLVGLVVAVGVLEDEDVRAVADVDAGPLYFPSLPYISSTARPIGIGIDIVGEDGDLIGLAVTVGVFEDLDLIGPLDPREFLAVGHPVVLPLGDPDAASGVDVDVGRVVDHRLGREQGGLEPLGGFEHRARLLGAHLSDRGRRPPSQGGDDAEGKPQARGEEGRHRRTPGLMEGVILAGPWAKRRAGGRPRGPFRSTPAILPRPDGPVQGREGGQCGPLAHEGSDQSREGRIKGAG